jgi:hypothetical protein
MFMKNETGQGSMGIDIYLISAYHPYAHIATK